jgi:hypothetical protein
MPYKLAKPAAAIRNKLRNGFAPGLLILLLMLAASPYTAAANSKSDARKPYALLFGTVFDAAGHPVYGVKVTIRRADQKKAKWELYSDHQGEVAQRVPAGEADYIITADVKSAKGAPKPETTVHIEKEERKDFSLHLK